jgi:pimeloyl-ACP methyl ester carboxylesterase
VDVTASTPLGFKLNYDIPANQSVVTETILEVIQTDSTIAQQVGGQQTTISGNYSVSVRMCFPKEDLATGTVQILTHGIGFDKSYWDVAPGYSYVDAAASNGSTTFLYDRLGVGLSDHPDPIQVVQTGFELAILHELTQMLRDGIFASTKFSKVTSVGHSFGSLLSIGQTSFYPADLDGVVLTGVSINSTGLVPFLSSLNLAIASENCPSRFGHLNNGYLVADSSISNQLAFLRFPNYPLENLDIAETTKQTVTFGELFTQTVAAQPAPKFTGPVDVVNGYYDLPFCDGDCAYPSSQAAQVLLLYPNAAKSSTTYLAPGSGHGLNLHYIAQTAYEQIGGFLADNGLA